MNLEFSPEQQQLRHQARRLFTDMCPGSAVRAVMENETSFVRPIWDALASLGVLAVTIPEEYGGMGLGALELCVVAEEAGRVVAPIPLASTIYFVAELLLNAGTEAQKCNWLPRIAEGLAIGAFADGRGAVTAAGNRLTGTCQPVADVIGADLLIVAATQDGKPAFFLVDPTASGLTCDPMSVIDPSRPHARVRFNSVAAEPLDGTRDADVILSAVEDRAAVFIAFEQLGGAERGLEMARDYALERVAFGRRIGSFQALKHAMADMYVSATLARSNCYFAASALAGGDGGGGLAEAAATARLSASDAYQHCARQSIQIHGGIGFTWEHDCHLHYRRAHLLALALGGRARWENQLVDELVGRRAELALEELAE